MLIKIRLLIFLALSQHGLACKYGIIFQISIYSWMQNCISDTWYNLYVTNQARPKQKLDSIYFLNKRCF